MSFLKKIHNNPCMEGSRMHHQWLKEIKSDEDKVAIFNLIKPFEGDLEAYTVPVLRGKNGLGNKPAAAEKKLFEDFYFEKLLKG